MVACLRLVNCMRVTGLIQCAGFIMLVSEREGSPMGGVGKKT